MPPVSSPTATPDAKRLKDRDAASMEVKMEESSVLAAAAGTASALSRAPSSMGLRRRASPQLPPTSPE